MTAAFTCCDEERRIALLDSATINGVDFLEVDDQQQSTLRVHFVTALGVETLTAENLRLEGGERITGLTVAAIDPVDPAEPTVLVVHASAAGDFSPYVLRLVLDQQDDSPPAGFDPILSAIRFSFKVNCPTDLDCLPVQDCTDEPAAPSPNSYLAKDYASFKQLMLDRLAVLAPQWTERNPADLGIALVELLAYVGDRLSYYQDAVATEAYLETARRRISVRRHARLVDYAMHDGCSARLWAQIVVDSPVALPIRTQLMTTVPGAPGVIPLTPPAGYKKALESAPVVFETMHPAVLRPEHESLYFYTWGSRQCSLPAGSVSACLRGPYPDLAVGDVLILEERLGPETGSPADADPARRVAVRLTDVELTTDPLGGRFETPPTDNAVEITEIGWHPDDALPFALCVSARTATGYIDDVSYAIGNIVLADQGRDVPDEPLGTVPPPRLYLAPAPTGSCVATDAVPVPPRYRPSPAFGPITCAAAYDPDAPPRSAAAAMNWQPDAAKPVIQLSGSYGGAPSTWTVAADLLDSEPGSTQFVVEVEDGTAEIRFGDDRYGARPPSGMSLTATYRVGNGTSGNVGPGSIAHIASDESGLRGAANPLPATGGVDPETLEHVRQSAPAAFRTQERAVTLADYGDAAQRYGDVEAAAASLRWTGSWSTVFVTADRHGAAAVDDPFRESLEAFLDLYRMAGQDLDVDAPRYVSLDLELFICIDEIHFQQDVEAALRRVFSNRILPDGTRGLFYPDNFTFGQPVYLSALVAAAQAVAGVDDVEVRRFRKLGMPSTDASAAGVLTLDRLEIARLEQNPDYPEHGRLMFDFGSGR